MGWFMRTFGQCGKIRCQWTTSKGEIYTAKVKIEAFNISNDELKQRLKSMIEVETGEQVVDLEILAFAQTN